MARDDTGPVRRSDHGGWLEASLDYDDSVSYAESARGRIARDVARAERNPHLRDHLAESEIIRIGTRQHPIVLAKPVLASLAALIVSVYLVSNQVPLRMPLVLLLASLTWLGVRWLQWSRHFFLATDHRILKMYGVLSTTVDSMKVVKVTDMTYRRGIVGEVLGFGSITIESAGQDQALHDIDYIPYPRENYQELCHIIIGESPRLGGRKQHRFRRRLERIAQSNPYARRGTRYEVTYPDHGHLEEEPVDQGGDRSPRVLYSSHEGRPADTAPIPVFRPGQFSDGGERGREQRDDRDRPGYGYDQHPEYPDYPDHDDPTRP